MGSTRLLSAAVVLGAALFACTRAGTDEPGAAPLEAEAGSEASVEVDGAVDADAALADAADASDALDAADAAPVYSGAHSWGKRYGVFDGTGGGGFVAADPTGNVFNVGVLRGGAVTGATLSFGGAMPIAAPVDGHALYVVKLDKNGGHVWTKDFVTGDVVPRSVAVDSSGLYIAGSFPGTLDLGGDPMTNVGPGEAVFVAKFSLNGLLLWSRAFGTAGGLRMAIVGPDVVLAGTQTAGSSIDFGGGPLINRMYLVRLNGATGAHVWSRQSVSGLFGPEAMAADPSGNIIVGGYGSSVDWGAGPISSINGDPDVFVAKFDGAGALQWAKRFGDKWRQGATALATGPAGEIVVAGWMGGAGSTLDFGLGPMEAAMPIGGQMVTTFVAKLAPNGDAIWNKVFSTTGPLVESSASKVAVDALGSVGLVTVRSSLDFGAGLVPAGLAKFDASGKLLWTKGWPQTSVYSVAFDVEGNALLSAGTTLATIDLGGGPLPALSPTGDMVLAKFAP